MKNQRRPSISGLDRVKELELRLDRMEEVERESKEDSRLQQMKAQVQNELMILKIKLNLVSDEVKDDHIGELMETALYMKGNSRNPRAALDAYSQIIQLDRVNSEAHYRYAFLHYTNRQWLKAIQYFQKALDNQRRDESNFPLAQDQVIKARLFIGYCAAQISKEALQEAKELDTGIFDLPAEGISIQDLSNQLRTTLENTEFILVTPSGKEGISRSTYDKLLAKLDNEALLLSFVDAEPFIQRGDDPRNPITLWDSILLKRLLLKSVRNLPLSVVELNGFIEETGTISEVSWDSFRQKVRRLNNRLRESGFSENLIVADAGFQRYRINSKKFYIVAREDQHL